MSLDRVGKEVIFEALIQVRDRVAQLAAYQQEALTDSGLLHLLVKAKETLQEMHPEIQTVWYSSGLIELAKNQLVVECIDSFDRDKLDVHDELHKIVNKMIPCLGAVYSDAKGCYLGFKIGFDNSRHEGNWVVISGVSKWRDEHYDDLTSIMVPIRMLVQQIQNQELNQFVNQWEQTAVALGSAVARNAGPLRAILNNNMLNSPYREDAYWWLDRMQNVTMAYQSMEEFPRRPHSVKIKELMRELEQDLELFDMDVVDENKFADSPDLPMGRQSALFMLSILFYRAARLANLEEGRIRISAYKDGLSLEGGCWDSSTKYCNINEEQEPEQWIALRLFEGRVGGNVYIKEGCLRLKWPVGKQ